MRILDLDLDQTFMDCFTTSAGPVTECHCGREHVCISSNYFDEDDEDDQEMIAAYEKRATTDKNLVLNYDYDTSSQIEINGKSFVDVCECEGWRKYMEFILLERSEIKRFLIRVSEKAQLALEHEKTFNILNDNKHDVLDSYGH